MLQSHPIPPCQYLLSILRFEERELVSIFMDVVKHEILAVFPNPVTGGTHTHAHRVRKKKAKENLALLGFCQVIEFIDITD